MGSLRILTDIYPPSVFFIGGTVGPTKPGGCDWYLYCTFVFFLALILGFEVSDCLGDPFDLSFLQGKMSWVIGQVRVGKYQDCEPQGGDRHQPLAEGMRASLVFFFYGLAA